MKKSMWPVHGAALIALSLASARCSSSADFYEVGVINLTGDDLDHVAFHSAKLNSGFGVVRNGVDYQATMGMYSVPLPAMGSVEWTTSDGKSHSVNVAIPPKHPHFDGILWLKIMPDGNVTAVPLTADEYYKKNVRP